MKCQHFFLRNGSLFITEDNRADVGHKLRACNYML